MSCRTKIWNVHKHDRGGIPIRYFAWLIVTGLVLTGCTTVPTTTPIAPPIKVPTNTTPKASTNTTSERQYPDIVSVEYYGQKISPNIVVADSPLQVKIIASYADEVDIEYAENGQTTPMVIAKLPTPTPKQEGDAQSYEYTWTPPAEFFGAYFWVVAKLGTQSSESVKINVTFRHSK